jgi:hypothetical protein
VPQRSIDRLALGLTPAQVRRVFGAPVRVKRLSESESGKPIVDWLYPERGMTAEFRRVKDGRMTLAGIFTTSADQRTASGDGVGSSEAQLARGLDGVDCGPGDPGQRWCTLGGESLGSPQTVFVLRGREVTEVRVLITYP